MTLRAGHDDISVNRRHIYAHPVRKKQMGIVRTVYRIAIVVVSWNGFSALATVYDSDGSPTNIQYIHDTLAQDGDTITIPAGAFTWSVHVTITKGITIQGKPQPTSDTGVCNDQTVLLDNLNPNYPGGEGYFHCRVNTGSHSHYWPYLPGGHYDD